MVRVVSCPSAHLGTDVWHDFGLAGDRREKVQVSFLYGRFVVGLQVPMAEGGEEMKILMAVALCLLTQLVQGQSDSWANGIPSWITNNPRFSNTDPVVLCRAIRQFVYVGSVSNSVPTNCKLAVVNWPCTNILSGPVGELITVPIPKPRFCEVTNVISDKVKITDYVQFLKDKDALADTVDRLVREGYVCDRFGHSLMFDRCSLCRKEDGMRYRGTVCTNWLQGIGLGVGGK